MYNRHSRHQLISKTIRLALVKTLMNLQKIRLAQQGPENGNRGNRMIGRNHSTWNRELGVLCVKVYKGVYRVRIWCVV